VYRGAWASGGFAGVDAAGGGLLALELSQALQQPGIKFGVKKVYGEAFERLSQALQTAHARCAEIHDMLGGSFRSLNAEFGFSLQMPEPPDLRRYDKDLRTIEDNHLRYLGLTNILRLAQPEFAERLGKAVMSRLKAVFDAAANDVELWNKSAAAQLDTQLRERRKTYARRIEAVQRIQQAAGALDERINELQQQESALNQTEQELRRLTDAVSGADAPDAAPDADSATATTDPVETTAEHVGR